MATYCFDLDGTLCTQNGMDYESAIALSERVREVNRLFYLGHEIIIFTARGSGTGIDHEELTRFQLASWGVMFNKLIFGKPAADFYVDDKAVHSEDFEWKSDTDGSFT